MEGYSLTTMKNLKPYYSLFKGRMGRIEQSTMQFNLQELVPPHDNLETLSHDFTKDEIDTIVKKMLDEKSLGLDGFNGKVIKQC